MGVKVLNSRLDYKIPSYLNNKGKLVVTNKDDIKSLKYIDIHELVNACSNNELISGLVIYNHTNKIIINPGYFYNKKTNKIYIFDRMIKLLVDLTKNGKYVIYYSLLTDEFKIKSDTDTLSLTDDEVWIGRFEISNNTINEIYPKSDISEEFMKNFVVKENYSAIGYRIYSDGWKEQWGNNANPIFPIAFNQPPIYVTYEATNVTNTGMTIPAGYWYVCGY